MATVLRSDPRIGAALAQLEQQPAGQAAGAQLKSQAEKWRARTKIAAGIGSLLVIVPIAMWIAGAFKRKLHVNQVGADGQLRRVNTHLTESQWKQVVSHAQGSELSPTSKAGIRHQEQSRGLALRIIQSGCSPARWRELQGTLNQMSARDVSRLARLVATIGPAALDNLDVARQQIAQDPVKYEELQQVRQVQANRARVDRKVRMAADAAPGAQVKVPLQVAPRASQERAVRALLADLVYSNNPAEMSALINQSDRIRRVLLKHADTLVFIARDPDVALAGLPADQVKGFTALLNSPQGQLLRHTLPQGELTAQDRQEVSKRLQEVPNAVLEKVSEEMDACVQNTLNGIDFKQLLDDQFKGLAPEGMPEGFQIFVDRLMTTYVAEQSTLDKRAIAASVLREASSNDLAKGNAEVMVAGLKGCGPYLHKLLQLMCDGVEDQEVKEVLQSVKSSLAPLDDEVRLALLNKAVERSNEDPASRFRIRSFSNVKPLSAASVGETMLATVTYQPRDAKPNDPWQTREVVIKLLRPGIHERAQRERALFDSIAKDVGLGMPENIASISDKVDAELDLRFEGRNVETAQLFNRRAEPMVRAMRDAGIVAPDRQFMVLERAPGQDVKHVLDQLKNGYQANGELKDPAFDPLVQAPVLGQALAKLGQAFAEEALFGSGFYHGDLHSGNFMFDGQTLTMIDFGNANNLTAKERRGVLLMGGAASNRVPDIFFREFKRQLPPDSLGRLNQVPDRFIRNTDAKSAEPPTHQQRALSVAREKSGRNDPTCQEILMAGIESILLTRAEGAPEVDPVQKLMQALELAAALDLAVPSGLLNVTRSMCMLESTISDFNKIHADIRAHEVAKISSDADNIKDELKRAHMKLALEIDKFTMPSVQEMQARMPGLQGDPEALKKDSGGPAVATMSDDDVRAELAKAFDSDLLGDLRGGLLSDYPSEDPTQLLSLPNNRTRQLFHRVAPNQMKVIEQYEKQLTDLNIRYMVAARKNEINLGTDGVQEAVLNNRLRALRSIGAWTAVKLELFQQPERIVPAVVQPAARGLSQSSDQVGAALDDDVLGDIEALQDIARASVVQNQMQGDAAKVPSLRRLSVGAQGAADDKKSALQQLRGDPADLGDDPDDDFEDQMLAQMQQRGRAPVQSAAPGQVNPPALNVDQIAAKYGEVGGFRDSEDLPPVIDLSSMINARRAAVGSLVSQDS